MAVNVCTSRLLLQLLPRDRVYLTSGLLPRERAYLASGLRFKYTAPAYQEVLHKEREKYLNLRLHKPGDEDMAKTQHLLLKQKERVEKREGEDIGDNSSFRFNSKLTTLENQMSSLSTKGFLRALKPYSPPPDLMPRFYAACSKALGRDLPPSEDDLASVKFGGTSEKFHVLTTLAEEFGGHAVHSSRLLDIKNLHQALLFYKSPVDTNNPYEKLWLEGEAGNLPPNLVIQREAVRFTGGGDHPMDQVTAFPRTSTFVTNVHAKEKYSSKKADVHPWHDDDYV